MIANAIPRYLLWVDVDPETETVAEYQGKWTFTLEEIAGEIRIEVFDAEPDVPRERLEVQTVVRGLEALDQPSRVTVVTSSHYVGHGIRRALPEWRDNNWMWERFGEMTPVNNADLWQRLDRAMTFHQVECRIWRVDHGQEAVARNHSLVASGTTGIPSKAVRRKNWIQLVHQATQKISKLATSIVTI